MDQSHESIVSMGDFRPMMVSPYMSPQLNETICGCRCGCGCGCAGDGNIDESERLSDSSTAFETSSSEDGEILPLTDRGPGDVCDGVLSPRAVSRPLIVWLFENREDPRSGDSFVARFLDVDDENVTRSHSLENSNLMNQSDTAAGHGHVQAMSPGPGIGGWLRLTPERNSDEHAERVYIFTPLRLSAEYQHARGKMVEHMLVPDEACFWMNTEEDWTVS
jgi:hypothetical protein